MAFEVQVIQLKLLTILSLEWMILIIIITLYPNLYQHLIGKIKLHSPYKLMYLSCKHVLSALHSLPFKHNIEPFQLMADPFYQDNFPP